MNDMKLLKGEAAFQKLFHLFRRKYESLGRIGGSVKLKGFSEEEIAVISGLTGYSIEDMISSQSISLLKFEQALRLTRFNNYTLLELLEAFYGETLVSGKEKQEMQGQREKEFLEKACNQFPGIDWYIAELSEKAADSRWIWSIYAESEQKLISCFDRMEKAFLFLEDHRSFMRISLFAQQITGNPHAFDRKEILGRMLLHLLTVHQQLGGNDLSFNRTTAEENELLGQYGLLRDDLWSFVTSQNLLAEKEGEIHPVWKAAYESRTVLNYPIRELIKLDVIFPAAGQSVWVVENSSVASTLMDRVPGAPIICTHGQLRLAGWRLIDLLVESNTTVYYSGDLDPEGIQIADRLKRKYREAVSLWRMDAGTYLDNLSAKPIPERRLNKLASLETPSLIELSEEMVSRRTAAYQEAFLELLVEDIVRIGGQDIQ